MIRHRYEALRLAEDVTEINHESFPGPATFA